LAVVVVVVVVVEIWVVWNGVAEDWDRCAGFWWETGPETEEGVERD
jgi:hypothetical protein